MAIPPVAAHGQEAAAAVHTAVAAAIAIEEVTTASSHVKDDGSPVTDADLAADRIIRQRLASRFPNDAILTEESGDSTERLSSERCWIVDPLDGTKQFMAGTDNYDVLIALVVKGRPVVATSCHPPSGLVCFAVAGEGAWAGRDDDWQRLHFRDHKNDSEPRVVTSIWYGAPDSLPLLSDRLGEIVTAPPAVLETGFNPRYWASPDRPFDAFIGWVPEGWMAGGEWDLVVADLIVHEAGGTCTNLRGELHRYNKPIARNTGGIIIASDPALHERLLAALSSSGANALR